MVGGADAKKQFCNRVLCHAASYTEIEGTHRHHAAMRCFLVADPLNGLKSERISALPLHPAAIWAGHLRGKTTARSPHLLMTDLSCATS